MKIFFFAVFILLILSACSPNLGLGVGAVAMSSNASTGTSLTADMQTGVHGAVIIDSGMKSY